VGIENSPFAPNDQNLVIENVLRLEKIAHNASWRNFILANLLEGFFNNHEILVVVPFDLHTR
jgi:hypothetical protein